MKTYHLSDEEADWLFDRVAGLDDPVALKLAEMFRRPNAKCALCGHQVGRSPKLDPAGDGLLCGADCAVLRKQALEAQGKVRIAAMQRERGKRTK